MMAAATEENETSNSVVPDSFTFFSFIDEVESRVELLRKRATELIGDQASLLTIMDQLKTDCLSGDITAEDREELMANMNRLKARCKAVQIAVHTVRDEGQVQSLEKVNIAISELQTRMIASKSVTPTTVQQAHCFLNACLSEANGPIDTRFQSMVLGCALDDQKDVRRRLESLLRECEMEPKSSRRDSSPGRQPNRHESNSAKNDRSSDTVSPSKNQSNNSAQNYGSSSVNKLTADAVSSNEAAENHLSDAFFSPPKDEADTPVHREGSGTQRSGHYGDNSFNVGNDTFSQNSSSAKR